ncbi:MAG: lipocalin family protein [Chlorobium sp.]|jgi:apolipoprotein D and lipocalin family protein|uniref:lipocalin family protein n=1 Tax=Chlorobium sp. TaxID=1095 RepID=UPI001DEB37D9|nr:lipocalin family protein [Chlorobium sp.]MBN1279666.1 lipocalin family protein [Chlorobiaceae bacterium]MCF8215920.1 lipocalin family protein [Chlorobium sp.]MCF8270818.1 lipocalin family protein [Chlorobium sp.]MCF8287130.1 lipocalin family protein [Chlorobium sp.]MCF8290787.1 lipocalin family protein [Chlorobium sp.]
MLKKLFFSLFMLLAGCANAPDEIPVVDGFQLERFLGTWHEIVRTQNSFQKDLDWVSASYELTDKGQVRIVNKAYDMRLRRWRIRSGRAVLDGDKHAGALKVSFFGSFFSEFNIIDLDKEHYSWALVSGRERSMFWIISRKATMDPLLKRRLIQKAESLGFDSSKLVYAGYSSLN